MRTIDLTRYLNIDEFDDVVCAVKDVVNDSQSLSLDSEEDRQALIARLLTALGGVVQRGPCEEA